MILARGSSQLRDYWNILVRRRWLIYLAVIAVGLSALIGSYLITPLYRATATLQIERENPNILTFKDLSSNDYSWNAYTDFYQTQYMIIASPAVAREVVADLQLDSDPLFQPADGSPGLYARVRSLLPKRDLPDVPVDPIDFAVEQLLSSLDVTPIRNSHLVLVSIVGPDPLRAAETANALASAYVRYNMSADYETTDAAKQFLADQIVNLKAQILTDEQALQRYAEAKHIISIDESNNITLQGLQEIAAKRTLARADLARAIAADNTLNSLEPNALPEVLNSGLIASLLEEYATYEAEYSAKANRFKADWPELQNLESKLTQARQRLELETNRIAEQVRASTHAALIKSQNEVERFDALFAEQETAAQLLKSDAVEYTNLQTDSEKKRETLNRLIKRENEMQLAGSLAAEARSSNVRIVEPAKAPRWPFRPNTKLNVLLGTILGLLLGVASAHLLDYLDNTVKTSAELQRLISLPVLAIVARYRKISTRRLRSRQKHSLVPAGSFDLIAHQHTHSEQSEAYRELRTSMLLSHPGQPPRRIMITSALPKEGKSATAINLAIVLSQLGKRVLIVDTDLRLPRLHKALGAENRRGVSTYLSGLEQGLDTLIAPTSIENLSLLPSGPVPPNPSELLNSDKFVQLGRELLELGYAHIVFDSPPLLSVSDPMIIAQVVDCSVLVIRARETPRQSIRLAADKLMQAGTATGAVLNDLEVETGSGSYYSYQAAEGTDAADDRVATEAATESKDKQVSERSA